MTNINSALKFPAGQPGEALGGLLKLLQDAKSTAATSQASQPGQIAAELAYKLAQASAKAKDLECLKESVVGLLDALEGINKSLSGEEQ